MKTLGGLATRGVANYPTGFLLAERDMPLSCVLLKPALAEGALDIVRIGGCGSRRRNGPPCMQGGIAMITLVKVLLQQCLSTTSQVNSTIDWETLVFKNIFLPPNNTCVNFCSSAENKTLHKFNSRKFPNLWYSQLLNVHLYIIILYLCDSYYCPREEETNHHLGMGK